MGYQQGLHYQHDSQMSAIAALQMPLRGEKFDIPHEYYSLHLKSSHGGEP